MASLAVGARLRALEHRLPPGPYAWVERALWAPRARSLGRTEPPQDALEAAARVLIAPANFAGQGTAWARALERHRPDVQARSWMQVRGGSYPFGADWTVPMASLGRPLDEQRALFDHVASTFTHVVLEAGRPLFGALHAFDAAQEARALQDRGVTVAMAWHGTDIRLPSRERASNPHSPFRDRQQRRHIAVLESRASRNARLAERSGVPQLYSTPDLAVHVPSGTWLPVVVDPAPWLAIEPAAFEEPWRALSLPSQAWIKGAELVRQELTDLAGQGQLRLIEPGRLAPDQVPEALGRADLLLDQFRLNLYGVAAVEAMMAGRVVVALAGSALRDAVRSSTGEDLPVVSAAPGGIATALERLDRDGLVTTADAARAFALRWHDGEESARRLAAALALD